jgi:hypothetical protein
MVRNGDIFAGLVRALDPYLSEIVFVGGWVHALYVIEVEGTAIGIVRTDDIDLNLPPALESVSRPGLIELVRGAGFSAEEWPEGSGLLEIRRGTVHLELLTEARNPREMIQIQGQPTLRVQGYPYQDLLRAHARWMPVGTEVHDSLQPSVQILVPSVPAYVVGKVLSSITRTDTRKQAKDVVYVLDLIRRPNFVAMLQEGIPTILAQHPTEAEHGREHIAGILAKSSLQREIVRQRIAASGYEIEDEEALRADVRATLTRFLREFWRW